jgi:hypothetical protein
MGVESRFYVLPNASGFRPSAAQVCELITRFRAASFLCDPHSPTFEPSVHKCPPALKDLVGYEGFDWRIRGERGVENLAELEKLLVQHEESDIQLRWPNTDLAKSSLRYPLLPIPVSESVYFDVELHLSADTVYCTSEIIDPFEEPVRCACGASLDILESPDRDFFYSSRLPNCCPACGKAANYSVVPMTIRDAWTGAETQGLGGITYRFCTVIDCGKMIPDVGAAVLPEFRQIIEQTLQCHTRVVQDFY